MNETIYSEQLSKKYLTIVIYLEEIVSTDRFKKSGNLPFLHNQGAYTFGYNVFGRLHTKQTRLR